VGSEMCIRASRDTERLTQARTTAAARLQQALADPDADFTAQCRKSIGKPPRAISGLGKKAEADWYIAKLQRLFPLAFPESGIPAITERLRRELHLRGETD